LGEAGYRRAAEIAHGEGLFDLETAALQKMHLELAHWFFGRREPDNGLREVRLGLKYPQASRYRRDLEQLNLDLKHTRALRPRSQTGG
jgi:hypothetical protein